MTLTIMFLWVVGIALLIGVAVWRGRAAAKKPKQFATVDTAAASAIYEAYQATVAKRNEDTANATSGVWVKHVGAIPQYVVARSALSGAFPKVKPEKPSSPANRREIL
ncbi:hypothetical protein HX810_21030 [Pseudomonas salomonii]|uniref:Uncharacterized protein n=1 Tax=Pseudomonas salomonii TaxID=191391 RepID=A0A7Y8KQW3_9PSED|nr:hypothetical protein [Pseudomonas salomonii]NWF10162.1 hypothetical protein [Pseudomonas salomonii]